MVLLSLGSKYFMFVRKLQTLKFLDYLIANSIKIMVFLNKKPKFVLGRQTVSEKN